MTTTPRLLRRAAATLAGFALAAGGLTTTAVVTGAPAGAETAVVAKAAARTVPTIALTPNRRYLAGVVRSPRPKCRTQRTLALFWDAPGRAGFRKVANPVSNARGKWRQAETGTIPPGRYFVRALRKPDCAAGRSRTITVR
jgi:hypothetical protein